MSNTNVLSGVFILDEADGMSSADFVPLIGNFLSDSTPSSKSIILYTSSPLALTVEIYNVAVSPTLKLVNAVLNLNKPLKSADGADVVVSNSNVKISPFS